MQPSNRFDYQVVTFTLRLQIFAFFATELDSINGLSYYYTPPVAKNDRRLQKVGTQKLPVICPIFACIFIIST